VFYFFAYLLDYFSLAVRDLSYLVKPEEIITSENLTTLLAIVSKYSHKDWLSSYETLTDYVVSNVECEVRTNCTGLTRHHVLVSEFNYCVPSIISI